ncbi:hypothetical protein GNI_084770, partial [Gregarina niphandrodes]
WHNPGPRLPAESASIAKHARGCCRSRLPLPVAAPGCRPRLPLPVAAPGCRSR